MLQLDNIVKYYPTRHGPKRILDNISFTLQLGEKLGILGCNGAGKSTLIRIIGGIEKPDSGKIRREMKISWPLALQGGFANGLTGVDNVRFLCRVYDTPFDAAMDYVDSFSELGTYLCEPVSTYSSGMRARLAFALSMAIQFDCYLIDEVSAVGDRRFNAKFKQELFEKRKDCSMVMVSHFYGVIKEYCNKIGILNSGRLKIFDQPDEAIKLYDKVLANKDIPF